MADEGEQLPPGDDEVRTAVATDLFDDLVASLDRVPQPNEALVRAG